MISTIEQCVKHLFSGQNTQQLILPLIKLYSEYSEIQVEFFFMLQRDSIQPELKGEHIQWQ